MVLINWCKKEDIQSKFYGIVNTIEINTYNIHSYHIAIIWLEINKII